MTGCTVDDHIPLTACTAHLGHRFSLCKRLADVVLLGIIETEDPSPPTASAKIRDCLFNTTNVKLLILPRLQTRNDLLSGYESAGELLAACPSESLAILDRLYVGNLHIHHPASFSFHIIIARH